MAEIKVASILDTGYEDASFDGVIAHAVFDYLIVADAKRAVECCSIHMTGRR
ncbi:methyltransferase domain-containing protein [Butyrivibrio proteoclasticus]|uniref:methyltransferase domain-containing protein n=1 Tax=Butyrivibrio proteoclasticus TaxID=43305 RepID=UPI003B5062C6